MENWLVKLKKEEVEILDYVDSICKSNNIQYFLIGGTLLGAVRHEGFIPWDDDIDIAMFRKDYKKFIKCFKTNDKYFLDSYATNKKYWLPFIKIRKNGTKYIEKDQVNYKGHVGIWIDIFPIDNGGHFEKLRFKLTAVTRSIISKKNKVEYGRPNFIKNMVICICSVLPRRVIQGIQNKIMGFSKNDNSEYILNLGSQYGYKKQRHLRENFTPTKMLKFENKKYPVPNNYKAVLEKIYGKNYMVLPPIEKRVTHSPICIEFEDGEKVEFDEKI